MTISAAPQKMNKQTKNNILKLYSMLEDNPSTQKKNLGKTAAEHKMLYRLFSNTTFTEEYIQEEYIKSCHQALAKGGKQRVIVPHDTTEISYNNRNNWIKNQEGLGPGGRESNLSVFGHVSIVIDRDTSSFQCIGSADLYFRDKDRVTCKEKKNRNSGPFEGEKTRWLTSMLDSDKELKKVNPELDILHVCDREADIYPLMECLNRHSIKYLIRSKEHRRTAILEDKKNVPLINLFDYQVARLSTSVPLESSRKDLQGIQLKVRVTRTLLKVPKSSKYIIGEPRPEPMYINVIEAFDPTKAFPNPYLKKEDREEEGIYWRLFTNESIETEEELLDLLNCYQQRWRIETYFKYLKSDGFDIENICLRDGGAIRKMILMAISASDKILRLREAGLNQDNETSALTIFTKKEVDFLETIFVEHLDGEKRSPYNSNPFNYKSMAWAYWVIASLGGFDGIVKKTKHAASIKKVEKGLERFYIMYDTAKMLGQIT